MRTRPRPFALVGLAIVAVWVGGARAGEAAPRPLSPAEVAAVRLAADYLDGGPAAWLEELAPGSELGGLGRDAALAAIETLAGPPAGARWTLQAADTDRPLRAVFAIDFPSGLEEVLVLDFADTAGGPRLASLRIAAQPVPVTASDDTVAATAPAKRSSANPRPSARRQKKKRSRL